VAAAYNATDIAIALINNKADVNIQNNEGNTCLHIVVDYEMMRVLRSLIERKDLRMNIENAEGKIPLILALERENVSILQYLVPKTEHLPKNVWLDILTFANKHRMYSIVTKVEQKLAKGGSRRNTMRRHSTRRKSSA
jgi:ankyrin repeat protein